MDFDPTTYNCLLADVVLITILDLSRKLSKTYFCQMWALMCLILRPVLPTSRMYEVKMLKSAKNRAPPGQEYDGSPVRFDKLLDSQ